MRKLFFSHIPLQYYLFWLKALPDLPLLYLQGKETRKRIPKLPDATDNSGIIETGKKKTISVLFLGESTIAGVGVDSHKNGFAGYMSRALSQMYDCNIKYQVIAQSGWTASDLFFRLSNWDPDQNYKLIVIGLGGNDSFQFTSPAKWKKFVTNLIHLIRNKCPLTPQLFCNLPPTSEFIAFPPLLQRKIGDMTEMLRLSLSALVKEEKNVYFNDEAISLPVWSKRNKLNANPSLYFSDGVHPSQLTYEIWGKEMASFAKASSIIL